MMPILLKSQTNSLRRLAPTLSLGLCLSVPALAQSGAAPGDISRQVEPLRVPALPALEQKPQRITQPSAPAPGMARVQVKRWLIQGNQMLGTDTLLPLLQPFTGVDLTFQQIREAAAVVQQAYEDGGWLARVDVPAQDVTEGRVTLLVTESRLGEVRLDAQASSRVQPERLATWVRAVQVAGQPLNIRQLDRRLLLADDLPGVSVAGTLQASAQPGATDVILNAAAEKPLTLDLGLDNQNARSVGASRLVASGTWNSPAGWGESYSAQAFKSEGSDYLRLGASAPLGTSGLRGSLGLGQLDYEVITPDANGAKQDISGRSQTLSVDLGYPLLRSRQANVYLTLAADEKRFAGQANGQRNSHYAIQGGQAGVMGNHFDSLGGSAANSFSLYWRHGQVKSGQVPVNPQVAGSFSKFNWSLSRQQALSSQLSLYAAVNGQNTGDKPLDGSENMILGGPGGVRAYPIGEAAGPQGHVFNLELRYRLGTQWVVTPFYDHGRIQKRNADTLRTYSLEGTGMSVSWTGPGGWSTRAIYARRMGSNPNANTTTGQDQDGSLRKDRLWLTVSRSL
jgi:hemolysin activation/secretion protein